MNRLKSILTHVLCLDALGVITRPKMAMVAGFGFFQVVVEFAALLLVIPFFMFLENAGAPPEPGAGGQANRVMEAVTSMHHAIGLEPSFESVSVLLALAVIFRQIVNFVCPIIVARNAMAAGRRLAVRMYAATMRARGETLMGVNPGEFVNFGDRQCYNSGILVQNYHAFLTGLFTLGLFLGVAVLQQPLISIVVGALGAFGILAFIRLVKRGRELSRSMIDFRNTYSEYLMERIRGWRELRLFGQQQKDIDRTAAKLGTFERLNINIALYSAKVGLVFAPTMIILGVAMVYVAVEYLKMSTAELVFFMLLLMRVARTFQGMANRFQNLIINGESLLAVKENIERFEAAAEPVSGDRPYRPLRQGVSLRDVYYRYESANRSALTGLSAEIPAQRITALVGASGSGKSTLAYLLPRLLAPQSGEILFDGTPSEEIDLNSLRDNIAFAGQSTYIFHDTVRANIAMGKVDATDAEIVEAATLANAHEFVSALPDGYDTVIGEGAVGLSGGQTQRLGLARVFLMDADIVVLDEPTSALDHDSEDAIVESLALLRRQKKTTIIIAHRMTTIREADWVLVLRDGKLMESGPQEELRETSRWLSDALERDARVGQPALRRTEEDKDVAPVVATGAQEGGT